MCTMRPSHAGVQPYANTFFGGSNSKRLSWRRSRQVAEYYLRDFTLTRFLPGAHPHAVARHILCIHICSRDAYLLHDVPSRPLLLRTCPDGPRVRTTTTMPACRHLTDQLTTPIPCTPRLLVVLALGVYLSSFVKDLVCSPRPFAPPVTRLSESLTPICLPTWLIPD